MRTFKWNWKSNHKQETMDIAVNMFKRQRGKKKVNKQEIKVQF